MVCYAGVYVMCVVRLYVRCDGVFCVCACVRCMLCVRYVCVVYIWFLCVCCGVVCVLYVCYEYDVYCVYVCVVCLWCDVGRSELGKECVLCVV